MQLFVAGSINQDILLELERYPMIGETLSASKLSYAAGGKGANQAVAAARAGAEVIFLGAVGDDEFGKSLVAGLQAEGISASGISIRENIQTGLALVSVAQQDNSIVIYSGANGDFLPEDIEREMKDNVLKSDDFVLAQLEIPQETTLALFELANQTGATCILNPAPYVELNDKLIANTDYLIVNEIEMSMMFGESSLKDIVNKFKLSGVIVTLGKNGIIGSDGNNDYEVEAVEVKKVVDTTGAGDCFVGVFTAFLMQTQDFEAALKYANQAASMSVQTLGAQTSMPTREQILDA